MNPMPSTLQDSQKPEMGGRSARTSAADEELLHRFERGDQGAFEELFRRYRRPLFHFILRFLRDTNASQDALQDLFLRVIRDPGRFQARSRFSTWLHTVARNLCIDMLRKKKHRDAVSLDQPRFTTPGTKTGPPMVEELKSPLGSPEHQSGCGSLRLSLLVAIRSIPNDQRVVFLLHEVGGLPFDEIAKVTAVPVNTAKSRMRYALVNLRKALVELGVEP